MNAPDDKQFKLWLSRKMKTARQDELARVPYEQREGSGGGGLSDLMKLSREAYGWSPAADVEDIHRAYKDPSLGNLTWAALAATGPVGKVFKKGAKAAKSLWRTTKKPSDGIVGANKHQTMLEKGYAPTEDIASYLGSKGEVRGEHRNRLGDRWEEFKKDVAEKGIENPIFIIVDHNGSAKISEGNHRIDAAVELGMKEVPVEVRYKGGSNFEGLLSERGLGGRPVKYIPRERPWHIKEEDWEKLSDAEKSQVVY